MPAKREIPDALDLIRLYQSGAAMRQILKQRRISDCLFRRLLRDHGVPIRSMKEAGIIRRNRPVPLRQWTPDSPDDVIRRYRSGESAKEIGKSFCICPRAVSRFLERHQIPVRGRSEAELIKWEKIKKTPGGVERQCRKAWEAAEHSDDVLEASIMDAYQDMNESCYTLAEKFNTSPSNVIRIFMKNGTHNGRYRAAHGRQRNAHGFCSPYEIPILNALIDLGLKPIHQYALGTRNLDIAFPESHVGLEIERRYLGDSHSITRERLKNIFDAGWRILIINDPNCRGISAPCVAQQVIAFLDFLSANPSSPGQYGVIDRHGKRKSRLSRNLNGWTRIQGF